MPAGTFERSSPSAVAATPASSGESTPEKHRALSENRKVTFFLTNALLLFCFYSFKESSADLFCKLKVFQTNYGKAETCAHQRESGPAEDPHHGSSEERCKDIIVAI